MMMIFMMTMMTGTGEWEVEDEEGLQQEGMCKARW